MSPFLADVAKLDADVSKIRLDTVMEAVILALDRSFKTRRRDGLFDLVGERPKKRRRDENERMRVLEMSPLYLSSVVLVVVVE